MNVTNILPVLAICTESATRELADKLHIGVRGLQQIIAVKIADLTAGQEMFGLGVKSERV
jgi:hypothetical protein